MPECPQCEGSGEHGHTGLQCEWCFGKLHVSQDTVDLFMAQRALEEHNRSKVVSLEDFKKELSDMEHQD